MPKSRSNDRKRQANLFKTMNPKDVAFAAEIAHKREVPVGMAVEGLAGVTGNYTTEPGGVIKNTRPTGGRKSLPARRVLGELRGELDRIEKRKRKKRDKEI